jgi:pyruvate dehydrogenase E1 component alpha subunit
VEDSVRFAEESPWPDNSEVLKDIYHEDLPELFVTD